MSTDQKVCTDAISLGEKSMPVNVPVPQPNPGIPVPNEDRPIIVPPGPTAPRKIDEPPSSEPEFPVREPGTPSPPHLVQQKIMGMDAAPLTRQ